VKKALGFINGIQRWRGIISVQIAVFIRIIGGEASLALPITLPVLKGWTKIALPNSHRLMDEFFQSLNTLITPKLGTSI
jgi:hypothetical protein